ncbi:bile acid:sodium symporter family protein [Corynebacterium epidermidicanis]|uniref:Putative Na+-dependent transporter n=1 Tax=Corynebacterium epidermidicanis TaxID=1050174 RepID=A0A0G3GT35_9CORY|nr:bile acid:sodium symporter family protein [Corynebacterium epidermidicanis]AKK04341.1 putative Na+-dependent transporter [Corynebacterium epidermidicanis]
MSKHIKLPKPDILIVLIILAACLGLFFPAHGWFAEAFSAATKVAIALLFFLYGARLSTAEALAGLKHWRLHLTILAFTFVIYPLIGLAIAPVHSALPAGMYAGILYLTLVPSTVQSSVAFTSIARGNVAGAIVSASASNLIGVVATPLLVMLLMSHGGPFGLLEAALNGATATPGTSGAAATPGTSGAAGPTGAGGIVIDGQVFLDIAIQLLLPFLLGQLLRKWVAGVAANKATKSVDRGSIAMVVYSAFSAGMISGVWQTVTVAQIVGLTVFSAVLVVAMLTLTRVVAGWLGFDRADRIAIEFCGSKKSLATGLPMAAVIFAGTDISLLILPLMIYHQVQLMICSWLASRYGAQAVATA